MHNDLYSPFRLQSAHTLFSDRFRSSLSIFACLSVVVLSCFCDIVRRGDVRGWNRLDTLKRSGALNNLRRLRGRLLNYGRERAGTSDSVHSDHDHDHACTMSTATARAEARRKALLNRGADRLAKLTTSARGEDAPAYQHAGTSQRCALLAHIPDAMRNYRPTTSITTASPIQR